MRRKFALAAILVALVASPAYGADCQNLTFEGGYITSRTGNVSTVATALVGPYLQVQIGESAGLDERVGTVSHEIGGSSGAVVCPDGSVTFTQAAPEPLPEPTVEDNPLEAPVEIVTPDPMPILHPGTGGVQEF